MQVLSRTFLDMLDGITLTVLGVVLLVVVFMLGAAWNGRATIHTRVERMSRGRMDEGLADALLESNGFRVIARQHTRWIELTVDGSRVRHRLVIDRIVEQDGVHYPAEIKAGREVATTSFAHTRRQLLEYALAFGTPHAVLCDVERGAVQAVTFRSLEGHFVREDAA